MSVLKNIQEQFVEHIKMLDSIRIPIADFLNIILFQNKYIFINIWSIIHLIFGVGIMYFLIKWKIKWKYSILLVLLIVWELFEYFLYGIIQSSLFIPELFIDVIYDILIGMFGGFIATLIWKNKHLNTDY